MGTLHLPWQPPSPKCQQTQPSWASLIFGILVIIYVGIGTSIFYNTVCGIATVNTAELGKFDMFISICFGGILVFKVIGIGWIHFTILCVVLKQSMNRKTTFRGGTTGNVCQPGSGWWWVGLSTSKPFSPSISLKIHTYSPSANVSLSTVFG